MGHGWDGRGTAVLIGDRRTTIRAASVIVDAVVNDDIRRTIRAAAAAFFLPIAIACRRPAQRARRHEAAFGCTTTAAIAILGGSDDSITAIAGVSDAIYVAVGLFGVRVFGAIVAFIGDAVGVFIWITLVRTAVAIAIATLTTVEDVAGSAGCPTAHVAHVVEAVAVAVGVG